MQKEAIHNIKLLVVEQFSTTLSTMTAMPVKTSLENVD